MQIAYLTLLMRQVQTQKIQQTYHQFFKKRKEHWMSINYNYNINCYSYARNCNSGCCSSYGSCATSSSNCYYPYDDYYSNSNYFYSSSSYTYNVNCNSDAHYCTSGCCTSYGSCATTFSSCSYLYSDYYTNSNYYFPGDTNYYYSPYYGSYYNNYTSTSDKYLPQTIGISVGASVGYLLLFVIGAIICYCRRKPIVEDIRKLATHNQDGTVIINGFNPNDPVFGVNPTNNPGAINPTYPGGRQMNPINRNTVLPLDQVNNLLNRTNQRFQNARLPIIVN